MKRNVMPKVNGKSFRCDCGANVFTELEQKGNLIYYSCNGCNARWEGETTMKPSIVSQPGDIERSLSNDSDVRDE